MISKEQFLPYDTTLLSKVLLDTGSRQLQLRDQDWLDANGITYLLNSKVVQVDTVAKWVKLENGAKMYFTKLC